MVSFGKIIISQCFDTLFSASKSSESCDSHTVCFHHTTDRIHSLITWKYTLTTYNYDEIKSHKVFPNLYSSIHVFEIWFKQHNFILAISMVPIFPANLINKNTRTQCTVTDSSSPVCRIPIAVGDLMLIFTTWRSVCALQAFCTAQYINAVSLFHDK